MSRNELRETYEETVPLPGAHVLVHFVSGEVARGYVYLPEGVEGTAPLDTLADGRVRVPDVDVGFSDEYTIDWPYSDLRSDPMVDSITVEIQPDYGTKVEWRPVCSGCGEVGEPSDIRVLEGNRGSLECSFCGQETNEPDRRYEDGTE